MVNTTMLNFFARVAIMVPAFVISVSFHECSHALTAYLLGDDTAKKRGRLTLNPLAHVDVLGLIFLILFRIGWANPVPIEQKNFKYPRLFSVITALAGPFSNFLLAFIAFLLIAHLPSEFFNPALTTTLLQILTSTAYINIMLGCFNILPIPPLDGSHILFALLAKPFPQFVAFMYRYSLIFLLFLFMLPQFRELLMHMIEYAESIIKSLVF